MINCGAVRTFLGNVVVKTATSNIDDSCLPSLQIYNLPKLFGLEHGGDTRVFVMDNHRPFHLANIHSRHQVVVFDDANEIEADYGFMPSDGSDVSEVDDSATSDEDDEDELDQVMNRVCKFPAVPIGLLI
jgi:hypothetical protein